MEGYPITLLMWTTVLQSHSTIFQPLTLLQVASETTYILEVIYIVYYCILLGKSCGIATPTDYR